jgi:hypothetical protein
MRAGLHSLSLFFPLALATAICMKQMISGQLQRFIILANKACITINSVTLQLQRFMEIGFDKNKARS